MTYRYRVVCADGQGSSEGALFFDESSETEAFAWARHMDEQCGCETTPHQVQRSKPVVWEDA